MEDTVDIKPEYALKLVKEYLAGNWLKSTTETISLKAITRLYLCEDLTASCVPSRLLIRLFGGKMLDENDPIKHYNEGTESIVFFMHGHLGYGPKLYGVFDGGRLEEYIPSRTLTYEDLNDPVIRMQLARKLARFHSMKLPVSKKPHPSFETMYALYNSSELCHDSLNVESELIMKLDMLAEIEWTRQTLQLVGGRLVLSLYDMNPSNCLIRDTADELGDIVTLIDYEIGGTNWRGYDIGAHFARRMFDYSKPDFRSPLGFPDETTQREFIAEYLRLSVSLNVYENLDEDGLDSCDHLLMEVDFMVLIWNISYILFIMKRKKVKVSDRSKGRRDRLFQVLVDMYLERKQYFLEKYEQLWESKTGSVGKDIEIINSF